MPGPRWASIAFDCANKAPANSAASAPVAAPRHNTANVARTRRGRIIVSLSESGPIGPRHALRADVPGAAGLCESASKPRADRWRRGSENTRLRDGNAFERHFQSLDVRRHLEGGRALDLLGHDQLPEALGEVLHPLFLADADRVAQLRVLLVEDQPADRGVGPHDLDGRDAG